MRLEESRLVGVPATLPHGRPRVSALSSGISWGHGFGPSVLTPKH